MIEYLDYFIKKMRRADKERVMRFKIRFCPNFLSKWKTFMILYCHPYQAIVNCQNLFKPAPKLVNDTHNTNAYAWGWNKRGGCKIIKNARNGIGFLS